MADAAASAGDKTAVGDTKGTPVKLGFELEGATLALAAILPSRPFKAPTRRSAKYRSVLASVQEVGIVEPPVVHPVKTRKAGEPTQYLLLDGHLRVEALRELGVGEVFCLLATDDEAYTYNHKVNRLRPIHEHFMIMPRVAARRERRADCQSAAHRCETDPGQARYAEGYLPGGGSHDQGQCHLRRSPCGISRA